MSPQQSIAHYRIISKLGQGGMGEVWRATDTKLNRDVAIKILPQEFEQNTDRLARFTREAQVLASLNHPNIAAIYGVEERALMMELVEGPTLEERIAAGSIALDETLSLAKQIVEALEYAYERGVVHRDLKPSNVKSIPRAGSKCWTSAWRRRFRAMRRHLTQCPRPRLRWAPHSWAPSLARRPT
jgi:serine/threonine-protein kinase